MRMVLGIMLVACGLAVAPRAAAEPLSCPPSCDRIPAAAWVAPWSIPLNTRYGWPRLPGLAVTAPAPRFRFEELCAGPPPPPQDPRSYAVAERAVVVNPPGQWQLQAQVLHWRGETWRGGQLAEDVFAAAAAALRGCQLTSPAASPSLTVDEPGRLAAVVSGSVILHEYLVANPANSTITELALWATSPPATPWPTIWDATVLDDLNAALCTAYLGSCP